MLSILHIDNKLIIDQAENLFSKEFLWKRSKSFCLYFKNLFQFSDILWHILLYNKNKTTYTLGPKL